MTDDQKTKCHAIIHTAAVACGASNIPPIPGLGIAADMIAMTTMTMALAGVFGGSMQENVAKSIAVATIKRTMLKQPIKVVTRELSKLIPGLGQVVAPTISIAMVEATGWNIANELYERYKK